MATNPTESNHLLDVVEMTVSRWHTRRTVDGGQDAPSGADRSWVWRQTAVDLIHPGRWLGLTDVIALIVCLFIAISGAVTGQTAVAAAGTVLCLLAVMLMVTGHASRLKATMKHIPADEQCWDYTWQLKVMNPGLWNRDHIDNVIAPCLHIAKLRLGDTKMRRLFGQRYAHLLSDPTILIRLADAYDTVDMVAGPAAANHFFALCLSDPILLVDPAPAAWTLASLGNQDVYNLALDGSGINTDELIAEINGNSPAEDV